MALYTLKNKSEVYSPLQNYSGNNSWILNQRNNMGFAPTQQQTQLFNMIGQDAGLNAQQQGNFWDNPIGNATSSFVGGLKKRGDSVANALHTTAAAFGPGWVNQVVENANTDRFLKDSKERLNDIYSNAGYNSSDEFWDAKNAAEQELFKKYGFDIDDYWNKRESLSAPNGNAGELAKLDATREAVKDLMTDEERNRINQFDSIESQLRNQTKADADTAAQRAKAWKDYSENSYIGKKINQDQGKFAGDALTTLSTMADVAAMGTGLPMGIAANTVQGGVEGLANELSENGFQNFDWGRAGQNAAIGALSGMATAGLNKGLGNAMKANNGNIFKPGGLTKTIADKALKTSAGRGALSGAVGGAVGGATGALMNGQDVLEGALSGAGQGAVSGAVSGTAMGTVNKLGNKIIQNGLERAQTRQQAGEDATRGDRFFNKVRKIQTTGDRWNTDAEGNELKTLRERWNNAKESSPTVKGARALGNVITDTASQVKDTLAQAKDALVNGKMQGYVANPFYKGDEDKIRLYRGLEQEYDPNYPSSRLDTQGYESWTDNPELAKQYGDKVYYIDVPKNDIRDSYLDTNPNSETYGERNPIYKTTKKAGLNGVNGSEYQLEVGSDYQKGLTYSPLEETETQSGVTNLTDSNAANLNQEDYLSKYLQNSEESYSLKQQAKNALEALKSRQPAYAGGAANASIIKGGAPDGGDLVKADFVLPKNATKKTIAQAIKDAISSKFQGKSYRIGNTDQEAKVNAKTRNEMSYQQPNMNDIDFNRKGSMTGNLDELLENMRDASRVANKKPEAKPNVDYYISGRVPVDLGDGEVYYPRVDVEVSSGEPVAYNIADIKKYPGSTPQGVPFSGDQPAVDYQGTYGRETIIPQNGENVNTYSDDINNMVVNRNDMMPTDNSVETELYRALTGGGESGGSEVPPVQVQQLRQNSVDAWDNLARGYGYRSYDDAIRAFAQANPDIPISAGAVTTWLDSNEGTYNTNARRYPVSQTETTTEITTGGKQQLQNKSVETGKQIKNKLALVREITDQFGTVDKPTTRSTKPAETFYNIYDKMGLSDGDEIRQAIQYAEPGELIPQVIREAAGQSGVIDITDATKLVNDLKLKKSSNIKKTIAVLEDIIDSTPSTVEGGKNGVDALQLQRTIEAAARDAEGTNGTYHIGNNVVDQTTAKNLMRIADTIGEELDNASVETGAVEYALNKYSADIQNMRNAFPNNKKWQSMVDTKILGAKNIRDLRSSIKDLTRASIYIHNGDDNVGTYGGRMTAGGSRTGSGANNIPTTDATIRNRIVNWAFDKAYNTPQARQARINNYQNNIQTEQAKQMPALTQTPPVDTNAAQTVTPVAKTSNPQTQIYDMLNRVNTANIIGRNLGEQIGEAQRPIQNYIQEASAEAGYVAPLAATTSMAGNTASSLEDLANTGTSTGTGQTTIANALGGTSSSGGFFSNTGNDQVDILGRAMELAMDDGDATSFATLYQMYNSALGKLEDTSNPYESLTVNQQNQLVKIANAEEAIDQMEQLLSDASGAKGGIRGTLQSWAGNIGLDSNAKAYNDMVSGFGNEISKVIGKQNLPQITDDAQTAATKIRTLRNSLNRAKANYYSMYGLI